MLVFKLEESKVQIYHHGTFNNILLLSDSTFFWGTEFQYENRISDYFVHYFFFFNIFFQLVN